MLQAEGVMQNELPRAGCKKNAHTFYGKQYQPAWIVAPSADGSELRARPNPAAWRSLAVGGKQPSPSKQAPQPPARPAPIPPSCEVVDMTEFDESDDDASEAAQQQAQAEVRGLCISWL